MSAPAFAHAHFAELNPSIGVSAPATAALNVRTANAPSPAAASTAGDAVNAVIKLADAQALQAGSGVQSVNLGFKFGDSSLGVRVEMRGGEVHTQFNTDSPELRSALASQWQTLAADTSNRPYHFSDPVFASASGGSDLSSETGGGAARQDDAATAASSRASRSLTSLAPSTPPPPDAASAARPAASVLTSRHLHTFA